MFYVVQKVDQYIGLLFILDRPRQKRGQYILVYVESTLVIIAITCMAIKLFVSISSERAFPFKSGYCCLAVFFF